ncbi:MAG: hypothetical protein ACRDJ3_01890 [Solirubrobacteraceae bacterium]
MTSHTASVTAQQEVQGSAAKAQRPAGLRGVADRPWAVALLVAVPLALLYLLLSPPAADLAAATYRSDLFARAGFTTWDTGWYAAHGHYLPGYSLLSPALGALLGVRVLLACSAVAASALFGLIAHCAFGTRAARVSTAWFALGVCVGLLSGRVPFDLGLAIGLGAVLELMQGRLAVALGLAVLTSIASPVAGAFLALVALAGAGGCVLTKKGDSRARARRKANSARARESRLKENNTTRPPSIAAAFDRDTRHCLDVAAAALTPILVLTLAYPEGGYEPFAPSAFWPALAGVALIALLYPRGPLNRRGWLAVRAAATLYAFALVAAFAIHTPMGGNAARLGPLLAGPLLAGVLWEERRALLLLLAPVLLYWQLVTPVRDYASVASDPSVHASYYAPLLAELKRLGDGHPGSRTIVEVPLTKAHWEAAYLAGHDRVELARGWERQLDTRYASLFYRPTLTPFAYRAWLAENRVRYVALPDAPLDKAGRLESALIARGVPYLREMWRSSHWRLYRFMG